MGIEGAYRMILEIKGLDDSFKVPNHCDNLGQHGKHLNNYFRRCRETAVSMTCDELAATEDPMKKLYSVMEKEAFMIIQLLYDKKMRTLKSVVNKAAQCASFVKM
ncbi:uncharacterized protein LOC110898835 [Helianthus annuus]|uniref:uncharacterized protein LOC110898835 n=1 Tax=Helianthus annuus TaxID=4232 RepID=UPI000B8F2B70|nr:uncharacterized protein LOC110898835 [Helianthus annuus]